MGAEFREPLEDKTYNLVAQCETKSQIKCARSQ